MYYSMKGMDIWN